MDVSYKNTMMDLEPNNDPMPQAVILAAGRGSRLAGSIGDLPKCLAEVGNQTLLAYQLDMLEAVGIRDVCVVVGYMADTVREHYGHRAATIENQRWSETDSLYSFSLTQEWVRREVVVLNCDVLAHPHVLKRLLASGCSSFAIDSSSGEDDEHMKVCLTDGCLRFMSKTLDAEQVHGENVGMLYFESGHVPELFAHATKVLEEGGEHRWLADAVQRTAQSTALEGVDVCDLPWIEIDYAHDLAAARDNIWPEIESAICSISSQES